MAGKHGGPRPNSGRKPVPGAHRYVEEARIRKESAEQLKTKSTLKCPSYLTPLAKKEWRRVMRLYDEMRADILSDLDIAALVSYCEAWAIYRTAQADWARLNATVSTNPAAQRVIDKTIKTMNEQTAVISKLSEQLCLTPVGRARMGMNPTRPKKPGEGLLAIIERMNG